MPQYERLHTVDELPPAPEHYKSARLRKRALMVARNGRRWTRYASFKARDTAINQGYRLRNRPQFTELGELETAYRLNSATNKWILYTRFKSLNVDNLAERIEDAGGDAALDAESGIIDS